MPADDARLHHADNAINVLVDEDRFVDRIVERKELFRSLGSQTQTF